MKMCARLSKLKGVIFDFDGTIVSIHIDFKKIRAAAIKKALELNLNIPVENYPILELIDYIGRHNKTNKDKEAFLRFIRRYLLAKELEGAEKAVPLKGSLEFIAALRKKGIKTGIITRNCRQAVNKVIKKFNIHYDVLLTRDDVKKVKPETEHIKKAVQHLGLKKEEIIVVGDHLMDIQCAKKFGALSCGIVSENITRDMFAAEGADFIFESIEDAGYLFGIKPLKAGKLPNSLLDYLLKTYIENDGSVLVGPGVGADCAVFKSEQNLLFAKTDPVTLVGQDTGKYLLNVNINDLAVMGGQPGWFLCDMLFPPGITLPDIEDVFSQVRLQCEKHKVNWIGGHTEISGGLKIPISCGFLVGVMMPGKKAGAETVMAGDKVFLVKEVGIEAVSIIARRKYGCLEKAFPKRILARMADTVDEPGIGVLKEARLLWENFEVKVLHDPTEGGLSTALYEIAARCNAGFIIDADKIIFCRYLLKLARIFGLNPYGVISSGCLLGIISGEESGMLVDFMRKRRIKCGIIGEVTEEKGVYLKDKGEISGFPVFERDEITKL